MKIFIDTANIEQIKRASELGILDGVTTNPSLLAKEGKDPIEQLREMEGVTAVDSDPVVFSSQSEFPENLQLTKEDK